MELTVVNSPTPMRDAHCQVCPLHEGVHTVCVPTTLYGNRGPAWPSTPGHDRAIVVVGEAPGQQEDQKGLPFVGKAGRMLSDIYINFFGLEDRADVYLSNAVRCRPPGNDTPTKTQLRKCRPYLEADLLSLTSVYKEVILLAVGASAIHTLSGESLKARLGKQGTPVTVAGLEFPLFASFHPAYILRNPSMGLSVQTHLAQMVDWLDGKRDRTISGELEIAVAPLPPDVTPAVVALDCETYGFFADAPPQRYYHPEKMVAYDGVAKRDILRTVGLTWRDPKGEALHAIFCMRNRRHRARLWKWFEALQGSKDFKFLVGHNLCFDLGVLRYCYPISRVWLDHPLPLMDTIITNSLHDEGRPEKSLKNLSPMFGITSYEGPREKRFTGDTDPAAWQYQCQDTYATLLLQEKLEEAIGVVYGSGTSKLSPFSRAWYSDLLWLLLWMSEAGVTMSEPRLLRLNQAAIRRLQNLTELAKERWDLPLHGEGSQKALRSVVNEALDVLAEMGLPIPDLEVTPKTKAVSFKEENRNALLNALQAVPAMPTVQEKLQIISQYQTVAKTVNSYLTPLLVGRGKEKTDKDPTLLGGMVYPKWFPVPSEYEDGKSGGTKQSRLACSSPSVPTFPPKIKSCVSCRFPGGSLLWVDYSQIELRVAALLSGDPVMLAEYRDKPDLHTRTAKLIFGDDIVDHPEFKGKYRQAGKTLNFLVLYRGGAAKFQETLLRDIGIDYPLKKCQEAIDAFWATYRGLIDWQESVIDFVRHHEYFELPLIGNSRLFLGGKRARDAAVNEIVNIPVQAVAAVITQSAHFQIFRQCREAGLKTVAPVNIYDAVGLEIPYWERFRVGQIIDSVVYDPPYYQALCSHLGRRIPLEVEMKERKNV